MGNRFCSIPWIHAASKTNGSSRVCCLMSDHPSGGTTGHNFKTHTIEEIHNSEFTRKIRKQFLAGEEPEECSKCWIKERGGDKSRRTSTNKMYKDIIDYDKAVQLTAPDGSTTQMPIYWDLRFGNLCNLKCVMCGPQSSSMWYKDYGKINNTNHFYDDSDRIEINDKDNTHYDWYTSEHFWEQFERVDKLQHIYLVGGEPTIIEQHYSFLQTLIDRGVSRDITLEYDTNITNVHQRGVEQWAYFKKVMLRCSIDDFGEQNNYIRFPSKWHKLNENIKLAVANPKVYNNSLKIEISITWQILNAFTLLNLLDHFAEYEIGAIRILNVPSSLDAKHLPQQAKLDIMSRYANSVHSKKLSHLITYLNSTLEYDIDPNKCVGLLEKLDKIRGTDWRKTFVELSNSINTFNKDTESYNEN